MSTQHLNASERATCLLWLAVRRQLENAPGDADTIREIAPVLRWLE